MADRIIQKLLEYLIEKKGSDLYISSGSDTFVRIDGDLHAIKNHAFSQQQILDIIKSITSERQFKTYIDEMEYDFSISLNENYRFRVNAYNNIHGPAAVFRVIPVTSLSLADIDAPKAMYDFCKLSKGLILVVGPTGSGKSTTLAAMINHINANYQRHIITIEDPVEFTYSNKKSLVNQREVGNSTKSFADALKNSLRESPDIILVGEMRDQETVQLAITAAETGHLVFGTLHTMSAAQTVNRIIDTFSSQEKDMARSMLSSSLQGIISQRLVKKSGGGRVAVLEIMLVNSSIRNLIREDKIPQINSIIEIGQKHGMITMKNSVIKLIEDGKITKEDGLELLQSFGS